MLEYGRQTSRIRENTPETLAPGRRWELPSWIENLPKCPQECSIQAGRNILISDGLIDCWACSASCYQGRSWVWQPRSQQSNRPWPLLHWDRQMLQQNWHLHSRWPLWHQGDTPKCAVRSFDGQDLRVHSRNAHWLERFIQGFNGPLRRRWDWSKVLWRKP